MVHIFQMKLRGYILYELFMFSVSFMNYARPCSPCGKAFASSAADLGSIPLRRASFSRSIHTSDLQTGI